MNWSLSLRISLVDQIVLIVQLEMISDQVLFVCKQGKQVSNWVSIFLVLFILVRIYPQEMAETNHHLHQILVNMTTINIRQTTNQNHIVSGIFLVFSLVENIKIAQLRHRTIQPIPHGGVGVFDNHRLAQRYQLVTILQLICILIRYLPSIIHVADVVPTRQDEIVSVLSGD